jgi:hypothetical protein
VTTVWLTLAAVALVSAGLKATGPALLGGRELPSRARAVVALFAPAMLAALIVVQTFGTGQGLELDSRALGVATAGAALALRIPPLAAVGAAVSVAATAEAWW